MFKEAEIGISVKELRNLLAMAKQEPKILVETPSFNKKRKATDTTI